MGWETGVSLGFNAFQGFEKTQTGVAQSNAIAQQAQYETQNMADNTTRKLGTLESSFLKSGIALDNLGGTQAVFAQAAQQGDLNINRTISNANAQISNTMASARSGALDSIASGIGKIPTSSIDNGINQLWQGSMLQSAWNGMSGDTDPSPLGSDTGN